MKALGMIEVYGYLAAVEALDSALKAANVSLLDVVCVKGGLVTVLVTGDVGATKAAMDASVAAAERVGRIISVHVIPRPADDIERMLGNGPKGQNPPPEPDGGNTPPTPDTPTVPAEPEKPMEPAEESEPAETLEESDPVSKEESAAVIELPPAAADEKQAPRIDPHTLKPEDLQSMTVSRLRAVVRGIEDHQMTSKEIRFAKKEELIAEIQRFCGQEG